MFVDVEPPPQPKVEHPPTFTVLSEAELEALRDAEEDNLVSQHDEDEETQDEGGQSPDDDEASVALGDWRTARRRVGMTRIPPGQQRTKPQAA